MEKAARLRQAMEPETASILIAFAIAAVIVLAVLFL